ncbi:NADH-quinone oxidoreductase subunit M [Cumulibacter manganitolerans]|uniref:NADH-quinone oxidoreductase subunit M n=1 Tax=Cumulibacter manganitolerans TaxID=1884992 RepID=UPI00129521C6|nr:NADH-quinone oxidoreductase subunit M [Cumulibacter manganitolerans]
MSNFPFLFLLIVLPLLGAIVVAYVGRDEAGEDIAKKAAVGFALLELLIAIVMLIAFDPKGERLQFTTSVGWIKSIGVSFSLGTDGIALLLIVLTALLVPIVMIASWRRESLGDDVNEPGSLDPELPATGSRARYFAWILALEVFMIGVFAATDVFLFYVFFEAMLIPTYFLIGGYGSSRRRPAAMKFILYSLVGGLVMLASVIGLYVVSKDQLGTATFSWDALRQLDISHSTQTWLFLGFFVAFAIKAPLVPVHTWLPASGGEGPIGTTVLLVGILDKVGTFGFLRYCLPLFPDASRSLAPLVLVLAVIGIIYAALQAVGQDDVKKLVTYTSIAHFGYIALGVFAFTTQAGAGAVLYMFNHGISTGLLLLTVGMVVARGRSRSIRQYSGVYRVAPWLAGIMFLAGMAGLALPGTNSFVSEFLVLIGSYGREPVFTIIATIGIVFAALYVLWLIQRMLMGPARGVVPAPAVDPAGHGHDVHPDDEPELDGSEEDRAAADLGAPRPAARRAKVAVQERQKVAAVRARVFGDLSPREIGVLAPLVALVFILGFYPQPVLNIINPAVEQTLQTDVGIDHPGAPVDASANGDGK